MRGDLIGVVGGRAPHRKNRTRGGIHHHDAALSATERVLHHLLQIGAHREPHRAGVVLTAEDVGDVAQLLLARAPGATTAVYLSR